MTRGAAWMLVAGTIALTVTAHLALKWQVLRLGALPEALPAKLAFLLGALLQPMTILAFVAVFLASLAWIAAMTRIELSTAYPFLALTFPAVVAGAALLFGEPVGLRQGLGLVVVVIGLWVLTG